LEIKGRGANNPVICSRHSRRATDHFKLYNSDDAQKGGIIAPNEQAASVSPRDNFKFV
jgi:hypothetical protein